MRPEHPFSERRHASAAGRLLLDVHAGRPAYLLCNCMLERPWFVGPRVIYDAAKRMNEWALPEDVVFEQTPCAREM